jgi:hypothetical protein
MRSFLVLLAAAALSAEAPPPPQPQPQLDAEIQAFDRALTASRFTAAVAVIDKLIGERTPASGKPRPDPVLNALMGRLYLAAHGMGAAGTFLDRAPIAALPLPLREPTALAHAKALEFRGNRTAALKAYREAAAAASADADRRRAAVGIARQLLPSEPAPAREQVAAIANGPATPARWEAKFLLSEISSLQGDRLSAARLADEAWTEAANAPLDDLAPLHVATLRAGLAAARHDVAAERAMLIATNGLALRAAATLSSQLPVCGDAGVSPSDFVIFGFVAGPYGTHQLFPIAASRLAIVAAFHDALSGTTPVGDPSGAKPVGTVFTVSCRSVVAGSRLAGSVADDPLLDWFIEHGIYPASASNEADDKDLNAVADRVDSLVGRFGKDSPLLIAPRWQMMTMLEGRAAGGDQVAPGQLTELATLVTRGLRAAGAPEWIASTVEARPKFEQIAKASLDDEQKYSAWQEQMRRLLLMSPFRVSREYVVRELADMPGDWPAPLASFIVDLNANAPSDLSGRDRQAWAVMLANARRLLGQDREAQQALASAGMNDDLCAASDSEPKLLDQHFSYSDYPEDLIAGEQEGAVLFDFDLKSDGSVASRRIVYSLPSGLFDEPSAKGLSTIRYAPPLRSGKAAPCRGVFQPIRWEIEEQQDFVLPTLAPEPSVPTT